MQRHTALFARTVVSLLLVVFVAPLLMAQANVEGQWNTLPNLMPINPVHVALLRTGKVLVVSGSGNVAANLDWEAGIWTRRRVRPRLSR